MFIIELIYKAPLSELDNHMAAHVKFLRKYYKLNVFVMSGRKVPRTGGIILAMASSKKKIDEIMKEDPFYANNLVEFTITEFLTSQYHPEIKSYLNKHSQ